MGLIEGNGGRLPADLRGCDFYKSIYHVRARHRRKATSSIDRRVQGQPRRPTGRAPTGWAHWIRRGMAPRRSRADPRSDTAGPTHRGDQLAGALAVPACSGAPASGEQARGRRRNPARPVSLQAAVVAGDRAPGRAVGCRCGGSAIAWCETRPTAVTTARSAVPRRRRRPPVAGRSPLRFRRGLDHNTRPRVAGRGSAVFVHLMRPARTPTAGCIAPRGRRCCGSGPNWPKNGIENY
jgi:hypothetical protein